MSNFHPLVIVDRGSQTQPHVVENLNKLTEQDKGIRFHTGLGKSENCKRKKLGLQNPGILLKVLESPGFFNSEKRYFENDVLLESNT